MAQGPVVIFDKSTIQTLTLDESVLLDNFYRSNIPPVFFAECLADLEREMGRMKGTPESLVGAIANRTPDSQSSANIFHLNLLKGELSGQFHLANSRFRPTVGRGQTVKTGDSKGVIFHASEEEEAIRRWANRDFLNLERQIAKQWRRMIEKIDLDLMSDNLLRMIGPWRKPISLEDAKFLTNTIIDCLDQEHLLRLGLLALGLPEATDWVIERWVADRRKPLQEYLPYFIHMLSINIFFALVLQTTLLSKVKPSHQIDLAYLYYLPFCTVFTSRDNFHVQLAPLFMDPFQTFVHGDELKEDLGRLDEMYQKLPQEELDKGLIGFAPHPPADRSFLTTRLWDKYLPAWRKPHTPYTDLPKQIIETIEQLRKKAMNAPPSDDDDRSIDEFDFVTISRRISTKKGSYLRFSKETILKVAEEERRKAREAEENERPRICPPGTAFETLSEHLTKLSGDPKSKNIQVCFLRGRFDENGHKIIRDGHWVAEAHPIGISVLDSETRQFLQEQYEIPSIVSMMVLSTHYGTGKLGIARIKPLQSSGAPLPDPDDYEEWEGAVIRSYLDRHNL